MSSQQSSQFSVDRYVVIHVATTCDEHGVYVTKDSAEVIELGWILLDANTLEEVSLLPTRDCPCVLAVHDDNEPSVSTRRISLHLSNANPGFPLLDHTRERPRQASQHSHHTSVQ